MDQSPEDIAREEQIQRILKQVEEKLRKDWKYGIRPLHEIELDVEHIGEAIKETITREVVDECGSGYIGSRLSCPCGIRARYGGLRERQMITLHGAIPISRAYYYCGLCKQGFCPLDHVLKLNGSQCSRSVQSLIARFSSYLPFAIAAKELEVICGVRLSATTVQHYARQIGQRIEEEWAQREQQVKSNAAVSSGERPKRLYVSMDGVFAHIGGDWSEVKLAATYQRNKEGNVHSTRYYGTVDCSQQFGPKVRALAHFSGADRCGDVQMVADGAPWIWQETGKHFPRSVQVLDYYHAAQHLCIAANARYGEGTAQSKAWMERLKGCLMEDQVDSVIAEVAAWHPRKPKNRTIKRRLVDYLNTHRHRMLYKTLRDKGYHIGSGVMEAGCKTVVKARMAGAGMRWEQPGAQAVLHLCAHWRSKGDADFSNYVS